jgi:2-keto-4-pentenoate hydratase/2-oxohepta-3-ene-1,7-dioic acid hydratase in catechol pathway
MRFVRARTPHGPRVGVLRADDTVALSATVSDLEPSFGDDGTALRTLGESLKVGAAEVMPLAELDLLAPVTPSAMRDFMVFEEHVLPGWRAAGRSRGPDVWYRQPIGYFSNAATLRGPRDPVEVPGGSHRLDFELEVGAIVGRTVESISPDAAGDVVAGFLVLCDWSARDTQFAEMDGRLGPFKGKDFGSALGPIFITPDEIAGRRRGNGFDLQMTSSVNGRRYGADRWSSAYWSFEELVSYASWNSRLEVGSLLGSGTCQGGCISELSTRHGAAQFPWLTSGDEVVLAIEEMGEIRARVEPARRGPWPGYKTITPSGGSASTGA